MSFSILSSPSSSCFSLPNSDVSSAPSTVSPLLKKPHFHSSAKSKFLPNFPHYFSLSVNYIAVSFSMSTGGKDALPCRAASSPSPSFRCSSGEGSGDHVPCANEADGGEDSEDDEHEGVMVHDVDEEEDSSPTSVLSKRWDVLGLGQAMVIFYYSFVYCIAIFLLIHILFLPLNPFLIWEFFPIDENLWALGRERRCC